MRLTLTLANAFAASATLFSSLALAHGGTPIGRHFELHPVVEGLNLGVDFEVASNGAFYIAEKGGTVRIATGGELLPQPFIDISAQVNNQSDRGLLGLALHPQFPSQPFVYLLFTHDPPETATAGQLGGPDAGGARVARLLRVTADPATGYRTAVAGSERVILGTQSTWSNIGNPLGRNDYAPPSCGARGGYVRDCIPADELSHTIGTVAFGPDGMLYVGSGDGCSYTTAEPSCTRSLDVDSLAGKILRIDPTTGDGLSDNPFFDGDPQSNRSKVYQLGLRNPFRFRIDPQNGELYVGDVGWNAWEEINRGGAGANFGWPCYEGRSGQSLDQSGYRDLARCAELRSSGETVSPALYAYDHGDSSSSVQVGDFYRGIDYPAEYRGALFYSDYNKQELRYLTFDGAGDVLASHTLASGISGITQIGADPTTGEMLLMRIGSGRIERLRYDDHSGGSALPESVYTLTAQGNGGCVQAIPETRFWFWVTQPAAIETRTCSGSASQKWRLTDNGDGSYTFISESQNDALTASGVDVAPASPSGESSQRFAAVTLDNAFQLVSVASGQCVGVESASATAALGLSACDGRAAQRFVLTPDGNLPPVVEPIADQSALVEEPVSVAVVASDPEGGALTYNAEGLPPGLGINSDSGEITGVPTTGGDYAVTVTVRDPFNQSATAGFGLTIVDDRVPVVVLTAPAEGTLYRAGETIAFAAEAHDWRGEPLAPEALSWSLFLHHNQHVHFDGIPQAGGLSGTFVADDHGDNTWLELCVVALDTTGRETSACREIHPEQVAYTIETVPGGLTIPWEGAPRTTPFTVHAHVGSFRDLNAPQQQGAYVFSAWSDGGAASHTIEIGEAPQSLVATYTSTGPVDGSYRVMSTTTNKCVEYLPPRRFLFWQVDPARFEQLGCDAASNQRFQLSDAGDGTYTLVAEASNRAVAVAGGSTAGGASIVPANTNGSATQRWRLEPAENGYALRNANSGLCMAVSGGSSSDGTGYVQAACSGDPFQSFQLIAP